MKNMDIEVVRIIDNIKNRNPILVFGDYDADGTTRAAMLTLALSSIGAEVTSSIPNREQEGNGLSQKGIIFAQSIGANLIITCDYGINAYEMVEFAHSLEVNVIITDHDIPGETLSNAYAVLNPKRKDCKYPFKVLCGGGVALKLMTALMAKIKMNEEIHPD